MRRFMLGLTACLATALFSSTGSPRAEMTSGSAGKQVMILILGITEGPDPIPQVFWESVRDDGSHGDGSQGDGRPDIAFDANDSPYVTWAYHNGIDYDIAYASWNGTAWSAIEYPISTRGCDLDPRIFIDDSAIYIVWWEEGSGEIYLVTKPHGSVLWGLPSVLDVRPGKRPSIVRYEGSMLIAAENPHGEGTDIVLSKDQGGDLEFQSETVESIGYVGPLEVVLHTAGRVLWMDWRHSPTEFAYSVHDGGVWSPPAIVPWADQSWIGQAEARLAIRTEVLSD